MTGVEVAMMSIPSVDPVYYYQSYVNPHPAVTMEQFRLIQQAWKRVKDGQFEAFQAQTLVADALSLWGLQFYDTLFALDSALKPLFKNTFTQSKMLTEMVDAALRLLPGVLDQALGAEKTAIDPQLIPILIDLAERHVSYNVKAAHYSTVGLALVTTLEHTLGSHFDAPTKAAWVELWSLICTVMIPAHVQQAQAMGVEV
jgi:methyl-accepting chemotaxis protein